MQGSIADCWDWVSALPDWRAFLLMVAVSTASAVFVNAAGDVLLRRITRRIPGEVELVCWISRPRLTGRATDRLLREIYRRFQDAGIEIPYPRQEVNLPENGAGNEGAGTDETLASALGARDENSH